MLKVEIITPEKIVHQTQGDEVILPTLDGFIGVRKGHLPLISPLKAGEITVKTNRGHKEFFAISGGFVEVLPHSVTVLADSADRAEDIDEKAVKEAMELAADLKKKAPSDVQFTEATALLEMNLAKMRAVKKRKAHGSHPTQFPNAD